ncbi:type III secretion system translocon subunit SctE [Yersinia nurmii]|uniref:Effector protein sipB n=1 Tax=Yersinia nurmii TaxID=685706 RepID=A0AAW7K4Z9_9GAMM|nr:type III secretion system translocon subunit SctE [Yersinia nurmii]MDN0086150.1 type III secretion system translocon subunit SctE [Yersinia nurmii]CND83327.1 Effector protein sipB [Yersinia nurmii]
MATTSVNNTPIQLAGYLLNDASNENMAALKQKTQMLPQQGGSILAAANQKLQAAQESARNIISAGIDPTLTGDVEVELNNALLQEAPALRKASSNLTKDGSLLLLLTQMLNLSSEMALSKLSSNLSILMSTLDARKKEGERVNAEIDKAMGETEQALSEFEDAVNQLGSANKNLTQKKEQLDQAKSDLDKLKKEGVEKDDPRYISAEKKVAGAQSELNTAEAATSKAQAVADQKQQAAMSLQTKLEGLIKAADVKFSAALPGNAAIAGQIDQQKEKQLSSMATMTMLMGKFIEIVGENSINKLKNDLAMTQKLQEARQKDMTKKAADYDEQLRKAEETRKMTGCIADILGGLAIAIGAITSVFGGAGVALMAIGIALMVADPIMEAATGQSLTGMILNPFMEHIFMPLMSLISKVVEEVFDKTPIGLLLKAIDKATGANMMDTIHSVVSAAVTVAVIIAVAYFAKSAAKFVIEKMGKAVTNMIMETIKKTIEQALKKLVPKVVKSAGKQVNQVIRQASKSLSKSLSKDPVALQKQLNNMEMLRSATTIGSSVTQATGNIVAGNLQADAMEALAAFKLGSADMDILKKFSEQILEYFKQEQTLMQELMKNMSSVLLKQQDTGRTILRNMHV